MDRKTIVLIVAILVIIAGSVGYYSDGDKRDIEWPDAPPGDSNDPR